MSLVIYQSLSRCIRSCGIVVAIAFLALGTFQSAQASCGDWLVGHDTPAHAPELTSGRGAAGDQANPADAQPRRRPCNGLSCSRAPVAPLAPSEAPITPLDLDRAALLSAHVPVEASTAGAWLAVDEPLLIPAISGPPERPPRIA